jgi:hypothetical protein
MDLLEARWEEVAGLSNGDGGGALMKRILVLLTVMAMMVMLAMTVAPAFAAPHHAFACNFNGEFVVVIGQKGANQLERQGYENCVRVDK